MEQIFLIISSNLLTLKFIIVVELKLELLHHQTNAHHIILFADSDYHFYSSFLKLFIFEEDLFIRNYDTFSRNKHLDIKQIIFIKNKCLSVLK